MTETKPIAELIEKIARECKEATASEWDVTKIVKELSKEENKDINVLRTKAIEILEKLNPKAATIYASFHRLQVFTSKQKIEPFDRGNIIKSLLKETSISRTVAENIGSEVEDTIKDLKISYLTTALIREMVNVKLLEYGLENIRNQYARTGVPVFDVGKKLEKGYYSNKPVLTEYNFLRVIPNDIRKMHFAEEIRILEVANFATKPFAGVIEKIKGENETKFIVSAIEKMLLQKKFFSKKPSLNALNIQVACFLKGRKKQVEFAENISRAIKFLQEKNSKSKFCIGLNLFIPEELEKLTIHKENAIEFANTFLKNFFKNHKQNGFNVIIALDSKYCLKTLDEELFEKKISFLNCKSQGLLPLSDGFFTERKGIHTLTMLNLEKIALKNAGNETNFFNEVNEKIAAIKKLHNQRKQILEKKEYLKEVNLDSLEQALLLHGLKNCGKILSKSDNEKDAIGFAVKVFKEVKNSLKEFALFESPFLREELPTNTLFKSYRRKVKAKNKKELNMFIDEDFPLIEINF